jgi:uncharacterized protein (TIGR02145 family)
MSENLNIGTKINSTTGGQLQTDNGEIQKYCYNNEEDSCNIYGGLYEWMEAMQYDVTEGAQGICPDGWHIPTDNEWKILEGTVDSEYGVGNSEWDNTGYRGQDAGGKLKEAGTSHWASPNTGATNESGFTGLPGGLRDHQDGSLWDSPNTGNFWSSTEENASQSWYRVLAAYHVYVTRYYGNNFYGFSVRCLQDSE